MKTKLFSIAILFTTCFMVMSGCCDCNKDTECIMTVTVTALGDPYVYDGNPYTLYIDIDPDPDNDNHIKAFTGTFYSPQIQETYEISDVPPGTYYLHMTMDNGYQIFHVGYYGAVPDPWDIPDTANAEVECGVILSFNIYD